jgi:hypothetical protein
MADEKLELEPQGDEYLLRQTDKDGVVTEIFLSERSVLQLAQSSLQMQVSILGRKSRPGVDAVVVTHVAQVGLNTDLALSAVHLTLYQNNGAGLVFSLPLEVAKPLSERLPAHVANLEAAIPTHTKQ